MNQAMQHHQISAEQLTIADLFSAWQQLPDNTVIVDIRSADDFGIGHVPGSVNIPFSTVSERAEELRQYGKVYFYCYGGQGSKATADKLAAAGFDNVCCVSQGGMKDWLQAGYPVSTR